MMEKSSEKEVHYKKFQKGNYKVKRSSGKFGCPLCTTSEDNKVDGSYEYTNLLQHAVKVGEGSLSLLQSAKHSAMARYLAVDLAAEFSSKQPSHISGDNDDDDEDWQAPTPSSSRKRKRTDSTKQQQQQNKQSGEVQMMLDMAKKREEEALEKNAELERTIEETRDELNALITKERVSNDEIQSVRAELLQGMSNFERDGSRHDDIGIKKIGELDPEFFIHKLKGTLPRIEAIIKGVELCTMWQEKIDDPQWYPFKIIEDGNGVAHMSVKEDDITLQALKEEWGKEIHDVVVEASSELQEHSSSGARELWNFKDKKKAALKDVIRHVFQLLAASAKPNKSSSRKRNNQLANNSRGLCGE